MALGLNATLGLVLGYLEACPDPLEVAGSTPYAAWRRLCMHVCSEPTTAADVLSTIVRERPAVKGVHYCPAHQLVAELVLALDDPSAVAAAAVFQPVLATAACGLLNSSKGTTQSAQVQLGAKMLAALVTSSSAFTEYAAQRSAVTAALGTALYAAESGPQVRPAVSALISQILATSPAAKESFLACVARLISGRDSSGQQKPGQPTTMAGLVGRPHGVSVLEVLLSLPGFSMSSTAASAMQDVLKLLQDVYATHSTASARPAAATSAGTSSGMQGRVLRLKMSGKTPAPAASASPAQPAAPPEPTAAAGHPDAAAGGSAQRPQHAPAAPGPEPAAAAAAAPPPNAAAGGPAQPRRAPLQPASAAPSLDPTVAAAGAPPGAAAGGLAQQQPRPAGVKPLPTALLQLVLRTLAKMTEAHPQHMAQQMTPPVLNVLLSLLDPSMQHLACKAYAAAIVMDSLSWACVTARNTAPAESLINLFMSVKHVSILEAIHLLEHSCDFTTMEGKQRSFALLQAVTVLANRLGAMGAGSMAESNGGVAAGAASKGQHACAVVARRLARVPRLLPMLREMVQVVDRAGAGDTAHVMDLLFPHYTQHHQDRIAWIPEFEERHRFVTFLSELLEHPSTDPAHAGQVATVAHLLLQCARAAPTRMLRASQLQKAPRSQSPGAQAAQTDNQQDDKISMVLSALIAAIQPRAPLNASSSGRCAELSQAAVHAAEALSILASQPLGASELARPAAVEHLLQLLEAAGRPDSWDVQSLEDSAGKSGGSTAGSPLSEASARYRAALSRVPGIICQAAALEPSLAPKLQQASPKAAFLLAAALRLHHPGADSAVGGQVLPAAAAVLAKAWPALAGFLKPLPEWREWQGSPDIHGDLQPGQEQQPQQPQHPQQQSVLRGLNRQCFAHEPADLSLCTWGAPSPDAPELNDTCSSQPRQQGPGSARACDRMSLDGSSWPDAEADCVVFVVPVGAKAKAAATAAAAEKDSEEPLSPPSSALKRKLQLTDDAATAAATTTAAEQQQQQHEGSPAKIRALTATGSAGTEREESPAQRCLAFGTAAVGAHQEQQQEQRSSGAACQHPGEEASVLFDVAEALIDLHSTQQQLNNQQHGAQKGESEEPAGWWRQRQAQLVRELSGDLMAGAGLEGQGRVGQQQQPPPQQQQQQQSKAERHAQQDDGGHTAKQASAEPVIAVTGRAQQGQQAQRQQAHQQQQVEDDDLTELVDGSDGTSSDDDADSGSSGFIPDSGSTGSGSNSGRGSKGRRDRRGGDKLHSLRAAAAAPGVQALLGSMGFGQPGGTTESPAKAMLAESVKDGKIVFVPQKKLNVLPTQHRQAAKESGHVVAARMWRKGQRAAGAVWGYGWGRDKAAAEQAAAEASVAHMYVCGVAFAGLPPYTGPGPV